MACPEMPIKQSDIDTARAIAIIVTLALLASSASLFLWVAWT